VRAWAVPLDPAFIHGKWTPAGQETVGREITPVHHSEVPRVASSIKSTLTTPGSGAAWATCKPHESFALGTVCFFHPGYDAQGHIIPTLAAVEAGSVDDQPDLKELTRWLRVSTPEDLAARVAAVHSSRETYEWLRDAQLRRLAWHRQRDLIGHRLHERLFGEPSSS
jgi:hypothetical protein